MVPDDVSVIGAVLKSVLRKFNDSIAHWCVLPEPAATFLGSDAGAPLLQVQDLASLMGTCKEMRGLAATDLHWARLATIEFDLD